jgi:hypothetical protein
VLCSGGDLVEAEENKKFNLQNDRQTLGGERDVLDVLEVMTTEEHQIDEDEEVVDVQGFAAFFGVSWTSVCVQAAVEVVLSDVGAWKVEREGLSMFEWGRKWLSTSHGLGDVVFEETAVGLENFGSFFVQRIFSVGFLKFLDWLEI